MIILYRTYCLSCFSSLELFLGRIISLPRDIVDVLQAIRCLMVLFPSQLNWVEILQKQKRELAAVKLV